MQPSLTLWRHKLALSGCSTVTSWLDKYKPKFATAHDFYASVPPPVYTQAVLPQAPTDIRGVDAKVYMAMRRPRATTAIPRVVNNGFFSLKFFPAAHYMASYRKSYVAYTFTNKAGYKLNSRSLERALAEYRGKYRAYSYFRENLQPLYTAFGRTRYRKFIKQCLYESLQKHVVLESEVARVAGIFRFSFTLVPASDSDKQLIRADIDGAVKLVLRDKQLRVVLDRAVHEGNRNKKEVSFLARNVSPYNTLYERNVPGYVPKFPFRH